MTLTPPTTSHVSVGSVLGLNRENNMTCGKAKTKKKKKAALPKRGQRTLKNKSKSK